MLWHCVLETRDELLASDIYHIFLHTLLSCTLIRTQLVSSLTRVYLTTSNQTKAVDRMCYCDCFLRTQVDDGVEDDNYASCLYLALLIYGDTMYVM